MPGPPLLSPCKAEPRMLLPQKMEGLLHKRKRKRTGNSLSLGKDNGHAASYYVASWLAIGPATQE